jgi:signal transduction histidine kinase
MLDRLEVAAEHQRRFTADASHELRTPLTRMRTQIEVEQRDSSDEVEALLGSLLDDVSDMQQLVDDLLFLARRDASSSSVATPRSKVDLDVVVDDEVRAARAESTIHIDSSAIDAVEVTVNERDLRRLVRNLLSNAVRHAESSVVVRLTTNDDLVELVVTDDGPGIPESDRDRVFERFVRLDESRSSGGGGNGLGLAIVREIAVAYGGTVHVDDDDGADGGGARFTVRFPS